MALRTDNLKNGYKIIQDNNAFCFGIDAILLADFASIKNGQYVYDFGCGNGIIPLLLNGKINRYLSDSSRNNCTFTGLELQKQAAEMAVDSVKLNNLEEKIKIINGDIKKVKELFKSQCADVVVSNPPYMTVEQSHKNSTDEKTIARHEVYCNLEDLISAASYVLKSNGAFYMIHRPYRLQEIFSVLTKYRLTPRRIQLVYPKINQKPEMVLIEARPNYKPDTQFMAPLIMYDENNEYTDSIREILERI